MNAGSLIRAIGGVALCLLLAGCMTAPGKPQTEVATLRPEQVLEFRPLYKQNCAACHGDQGRRGAALSLANPVYLATVGTDNLRQSIIHGVPGTLMPAFAKAQGGLLTNAQIEVLTQGMMQTWGASAAGMATLPYASQSVGDVPHGKIAYTTFCASCHGANGTGGVGINARNGSIVDPAYLDLVSNQALRSTIIAGRPEQGMPDWRSDMTTANHRAMTDQEVTDTVAWIASNRTTDSHQSLQTAVAPQDERRTTHE